MRMTYSKKKATKRVGIGWLIGLVPGGIALLVAHNWLSAQDSLIIGGLIAQIVSQYGTEYSGFLDKAKEALKNEQG